MAAAEEASGVTAEARRQTETLQSLLREKRTSMPGDIELLAEYRDAVALEREGDSEVRSRRYVSAVATYESAMARYDAAAAARERQVSDVEGVVDRYAQALEAEDLGALGALHTSLTRQMSDDWKSFFDAVSDLRARLTVDEIEFQKGGATARLSVQLLYSGARDQVHHWDMIMRQEQETWLVSEVRRKS